MIIVARRKTAIAIITNKKVSEWKVNQFSIDKWPTLKRLIEQFKVPAAHILTKGGGVNAQLEAVQLCISKYLLLTSTNKQKMLLKLKAIDDKILKSDARNKLPKMAGRHGHRATRQKSYR